MYKQDSILLHCLVGGYMLPTTFYLNRPFPFNKPVTGAMKGGDPLDPIKS